jgi:hypothetical protein
VAVGQALDTEAHVLFEGTLLEVFLRWCFEFVEQGKDDRLKQKETKGWKFWEKCGIYLSG